MRIGMSSKADRFGTSLRSHYQANGTWCRRDSNGMISGFGARRIRKKTGAKRRSPVAPITIGGMKRFLAMLPVLVLPAVAQEYKIAVIGLVHSHVWGHLPQMIKGDIAKLVAIAEPNHELIDEAKNIGANVPFYDDYNKMLDEQKPDIVWAFVENNRHLEVARACATRKINIMFEKPLASTYKDAAAIRDLAGKYGIRVMTNYQMA